MYKIFLIAVLTYSAIYSKAQEVWTVGPMLHINFGGGEKISSSFAIYLT
jgi:hypothetical protein